MLLISGATGNVGGELVRELAAAGEPVRALTRSGSAAGLPAGAEIATGDLNQPDDLAAALDGVSGAFLLPGYRDMPALLTALRQAGVQRVVLLSGSSAASGDTSNAVTAYMVESETAVRESGLAATILRPSGFMSNTLQWRPQLVAGDVVREPFAGVAVAMIDPHDIAAVAAIALTNAGHAGRTYRISGPESLLPADRVRILAEVLERPLRLVPQPDDEARAEMTANMAEAYVDAFFDFYSRGSLDDSEVLPTYQQLTGKPARTFQQWARAHRSAFR